MRQAFYQSALAREMCAFHCPRWHELPALDLYMDQVLTILQQTLAPLACSQDETLVTRAMINNYVKQQIVSPPVKKLYTRKHVAYLIVVCLLKRVLNLHELCDLIAIQIDTYPIEQAYDYFCQELENALATVFGRRDEPLPNIASEITLQTDIVRSTVLAFAHTLFLQKLLAFNAHRSEKKGP